MEPTTCTKIRWFWPWQDDREEAWLTGLSLEGWHLSGFGFPCVYYFQKGDPKNFTYRLDYQSPRMQDRQTYLQLFQDAGWEHVGKMAAWEYFRKETADGEEPEIFTDPDSKIRKYRRVLGTLTVLFIVLILLSLSPVRHTADSDMAWSAIRCLMLVLIAAYSVAIIGLVRRIGQLKKTVQK
jgi:hypothetical protein